MITYAGIGSRTITKEEESLIIKISETLSSKRLVVYSGNAEGSDIAFQTGSKGKCVLMLPWHKFNESMYDVNNSLANYSLGKSKEALLTVDKYHPAALNLSFGAKAMMARNWHQIAGYDIYPQVSFVVCCADVSNGKVSGGTGQACRIAEDLGIPVFNIRHEWKEQRHVLKKLIKSLIEREAHGKV